MRIVLSNEYGNAPLKIIGATLTPFGDAFAGTPFQGYYTPEKEKIRLA